MRLVLLSIPAVLLIGFAAWKLCFLPAGSPRKLPDLVMQWSEQLYLLDDDEVERFLPPPYTPQRLKEKQRLIASFPGGSTQLAFLISPQYPIHPLRRMPPYHASSETGTIASAFGWCHNLPYTRRDLPQQLAGVVVDGDWVVRQGVPMERRMKAVESILRTTTGREIVIEQKRVERDVIIVKGEWNFPELDGIASGQRKALQLFTDKLDPSPARTWNSTFPSFLDYLEAVADRIVTNEVATPPATNIDSAINASARWISPTEKQLADLLENLGKQTSLEFVRTKRMIPIWFIRDKSANNTPAESR